MPRYPRGRSAVAAQPTLLPTQAINSAFLASAILARRMLCLADLGRGVPTPREHRVPAPQYELMRPPKCLWRFLHDDRVGPIAVQAAKVP